MFRPFARLHASFESPATALEKESRFVACLQLLLEHCTVTGSASLRQPARARDLIREHYWRAIRLDDLVAATGLSRYHLVRAFAKEFGLPPHAYQIHVQVQKGRTLLAAGLSPSAVAAETGFADQSHFTRHFRRIYGVTPGEYARGGGRKTRLKG